MDFATITRICVILLLFYGPTVIKCVPIVDLILDETIKNEGYHRTLVTNVTFYAQFDSCLLLLEEKFPKNIYVYDHDLNNVEKMEQIKVLLSTKVSVETYAENSFPFSIFVFLNKGQPFSSSPDFHNTFSYSIPFHTRYHEPKSGGGYRKFKKSTSVIYIKCPSHVELPSQLVTNKLPCDSTTKALCDWKILPFILKNSVPIIAVPIGDLDHQNIVIGITLVVILFGDCLIINSILKEASG